MYAGLAIGALLVAGFAGSLHCVGMCGAIACAVGADERGAAATWWRQLLYNFGRLTSYGFLGALVGYLGFLLVAQCGDDSIVSLVQRALAAGSGLLMVVIGLQFFGVFGHRQHALGAAGEWLAHALRSLTRARGALVPLALGVFNGLLPCPLVYAIAAQAASSGGPGQGALMMVVFGFGTFPAMLLVAGLGLRARPMQDASQRPIVASFLPPSQRQLRIRPAHALRVHAVRLAGALIVLAGLITLARGVLPIAHTHLP